MRRDQGFSLLELVVAVAISGVIIATGMSIAVQQRMFYTTATDVSGARGTLNHLELALSNEFLPLNAGAGDLLYAGTSVIKTRLFRGVYYVCDRTTAPASLTLKRLTDNGYPQPGDSGLVYSQGAGSDIADDLWEPVRISSATGALCPDSTAGFTVGLQGLSEASAAAVPAGAPTRIFGIASYRFDPRESGWYLVRKSSDGTEASLAGPLLAPDSSTGGPGFRYFDSTGQATSDPSKVVRLEITVAALRSVSGKRGEGSRPVHRTLSFRLRNNRGG